MTAPNYQVWTLEPESVEERRKRLLQQMGLGSNRRLSSVASSVGTASSSCLHSSDESSVGEPSPRDQQSNSTDDAISAKEHPGTDSTDAALEHDAAGCPDERRMHHASRDNSDIELSNRRNDAFDDHPSCSSNLVTNVDDEFRENFSGDSAEETPLENEDDEDVGDVFCIKNLDSGKEFVVVNEFGEDGTWNTLKDVETGRQLTLEEFVMSVAHSPLVQELMRRESLEIFGRKGLPELDYPKGCLKTKKKGRWFRGIKVVANTVTGHKDRKSSNDPSSMKGGKKSTSTDDGPPVEFASFSPERIKVKQYGKSYKELSALYLTDEIQGHAGAIWSMKFSIDGQYLASAGEDCVIHVWKVIQSEKGSRFAERLEEGNVNPTSSVASSPDLTLTSSSATESHPEKKKKIKGHGNKYINSDHVVLPDNIFSLSEKPVCSFHGHLEDVLDLAWSKSQFLLSSSMDKTVRLWHMSSNSCLKIFAHSDYVTCIQFNPVDDRYFLSGSLDAKVRIWSVRDHKVVDWSDIHEMVTAACYSADGQAAFVGTHKGSCRIYKTSDNKLHQEKQINVLSKKKKSQAKKITGFQCTPGSSSEVLITSADSRIRIFDGVDLVHKFKGFRNTSSQIGACFAPNGKYVICASEDAQVFVWRNDVDTNCPGASSRNKSITHSYENFHCRDITIATAWPYNLHMDESLNDRNLNGDHDTVQTALLPKIKAPSLKAPSIHLLNLPPKLLQGFKPPAHGNKNEGSRVSNSREACNSISQDQSLQDSDTANNSANDNGSATCPEEKLAVVNRNNSSSIYNSGAPDCTDGSSSGSSKLVQSNKSSATAWGMVILTAGVGGEIRTYQNFGLPRRV